MLMAGTSPAMTGKKIRHQCRSATPEAPVGATERDAIFDRRVARRSFPSDDDRAGDHVGGGRAGYSIQYSGRSSASAQMTRPCTRPSTLGLIGRTIQALSGETGYGARRPWRPAGSNPCRG